MVHFLLLGEMNDFRQKSGLTCSFLIFTALNLAMLIVGIDAIDECPDEQMVPNYLIGEGET